MTINSVYRGCFVLLLLGCPTEHVIAQNWNEPSSLIIDATPVPILSPQPFHSRCEVPPDEGYRFTAKEAKYVTSNYKTEIRPIKESIQNTVAQLLNEKTRDSVALKRYMSDFSDFIRAGNYQGVRDSQAGLDRSGYYADGKGSPDPGYGAQTLLLSAALLVSVADELKAWSSPADRDLIINWGNSLQRQSHRDRRGRAYSQQGADNVAMRSASYLAWSSVSGVSSLRYEAERAFENVLNRVNADGSMTYWLDRKHRAYRKDLAFKEDDKTIGYLVLAAHFSSSFGDNWYEKKNRDGKSLLDVVEWLIIAHTQPEKTNQARKLKDQARIDSGMRPSDWAWTAVFVNDQANIPLGSRMREVSRLYEGFGFWNKHLGHTSCYYGFVGEGNAPVDITKVKGARLKLNTSKSEACSDPVFAKIMGQSCN